jgi:hypothetical protein
VQDYARLAKFVLTGIAQTAQATLHKRACRRATAVEDTTMTLPLTMQDPQDHFAHCVQILGGTTAASRRLGIDERAIRRFVSGERPVSTGLLEDTAKALGALIDEARAAQQRIAETIRSADQG